MGGNSLSAGVGWPQLLWGANQGGLLDNNAGPPMINFAGNIPYTNIGQTLAAVRLREEQPLAVLERPDVGEGPAHAQRWASSTAITSSRPRGWGDQHRRRSSTSIASAPAATTARATISARPAIRSRRSCLARCSRPSQTIPVYPTFNEAYTAAWINDEFKVSDKLTLTLGLRFDYQFARTESDDQYSTFDPNTPNPGAGNIPGALIFAGTGAGPHREPDVPRHRTRTPGGRGSVSPIDSDDKNAIRGGYGIYYSGVAFVQFVGQPTLGFQANLLAPEPVQRRVAGVLSGQRLPADRVVQPPFIDPTFANGDRADRGDAERVDAAALPELVRDVPAPAHRQHDAGRVVHREPRQPPESPLRRRWAWTPT